MRLQFDTGGSLREIEQMRQISPWKFVKCSMEGETGMGDFVTRTSWKQRVTHD